jgi:6-pyruvoyltetrahydropterin/6-carboxytetrahydropterin synthase
VKPLGYTAVVRFSCAHFYQQPLWTAQQNQQEFGRCYSKYGHGHDYVLRVQIQAEAKQLQVLGPQLDRALTKIKNELDHRHLNFDFTEFQNVVPTTENISAAIVRRLSPEFTASLSLVQLHETPEIFVRTLLAAE